MNRHNFVEKFKLKETESDKETDLVIEKVRNDEVFVISNKSEEELVDIAIKIFLSIEGFDSEYADIEAKRCREELLNKEELRPLGYAIYLRRGKLYVDSRNHRHDDEMKQQLEQIVMSVL